MVISKSIQLKAFLLLLVFSLNTLVGFACAVGIDMGYNSSHHKEKNAVIPSHLHTKGNAHQHHNQQAVEPAHQHKLVSNVQAKNCHSVKDDEKKHPEKKDEDCCTNSVLQFQSLDKNLNQNSKFVPDAPFIAFIPYLYILTEENTITNSHLVHSSRYLFPPPPNILVAIQKFQV